MDIFIRNLTNFPILDFEMVERKGLGHPDTICDEIAEAVSVALSQYYLEHFGTILHHNVDKALLVGGLSAPKFGGGQIKHPMELIIAGRATHLIKEHLVPIDEIAINTAKDWLKKRLRYLDVENTVTIIPKIRSGSQDLVALFERFGMGEVPFSNDTSFGVGFYPLSALENQVLAIEKLLRHPETQKAFPCIGEDTKVMGVREYDKFYFTVAIAMVDQYIPHIQAYVDQVEKIKNHLASRLNLEASQFFINTADDYTKESVYLTVTGCSAENGDDGQVGRGNRINGLITPYRPMSLEATAGKNAISHVGKIYNLWANEVCRDLCKNGLAGAAEIFIVSQIGKPINEPTLLDIRIQDAEASEDEIKSFVRGKLQEMPFIWKQVLSAKHPFEPFS
ncbi:methionine adenosyltransferase [Cecembia lonarensis]|uniref:S-adenosylmethionine synthetase n=1 Tax=Cecembia lonarensis (strain CCUG 58316 / KCTC 22772 / LW9) TaxID=1225176 RepID=K1LDE2_CECL9|nr:methionine adenosyltransferase [Cecembia lonarensis]EKB48373.1 S-adenosylmethionine synthetase [Cecembia lonarensis LW9]